MSDNIIKDETDSVIKSFKMDVSINVDDGKNKIDKIVDEFAESKRLKQGFDKVKKGVVFTTKFSILFIIIGFILLIFLVALGIIS